MSNFVNGQAISNKPLVVASLPTAAAQYEGLEVAGQVQGRVRIVAREPMTGTINGSKLLTVDWRFLKCSWKC